MKVTEQHGQSPQLCQASQTKSGLKIYLRLIKYLKLVIIPFVVSIVGFALFAATQPALAKLLGLIIEAIESKGTPITLQLPVSDASLSFDPQYWLPLVAIIIFIVRGIGTFLGSYYNEYAGAKLTAILKTQIFNHLTILPAEFFDKNQQGQLLHRLNTGVGQIQKAITGALKTIIREGLTILFLLAYVFYLNWQLSLIFLAITPCIALIVMYTTRRFRKITKKSEIAMGQVMQVSKEMVTNISVIRAFGAQIYEKNRFKEAIGDVFKRQMKIQKIAAIAQPVNQLLVAMAIAGIVFLLLGAATLEGNTASELITYLTAVALLPKSLKQLSGVNVTIQRGIIAAGMLFEILDSEPEKDEGAIVKDNVEGNIHIDNVSFKYPTTDHLVLKNISLNIKKGEMVALVGRSGSGKSTLVSLLYRVYDVDNGSIQIDGVDIKDYQLTNLRQHIAVVNQQVTLFDGTIKNNIAYGAEYSDEAIIEAAKKAHALEFIEKTPNGMDSMVGDNGLKFSGGQRQRLAIARAFLKNAPILIMDEATSALDNESEHVIKEALESVVENRTTIVIAHRLSTVMKADRIIVMDNGEIIEQGSHHELLAKNGYYTNLYNMGFEEQDAPKMV